MNPFRKKEKQLTREQLRRRVIVMLALAGLLCLFALVAPYLTPNDPNMPNAAYMNASPCKEFPLGADRYGRCVLSRVMIGARRSCSFSSRSSSAPFSECCVAGTEGSSTL